MTCRATETLGEREGAWGLVCAGPVSTQAGEDTPEAAESPQPESPHVKVGVNTWSARTMRCWSKCLINLGAQTSLTQPLQRYCHSPMLEMLIWSWGALGQAVGVLPPGHHGRHTSPYSLPLANIKFTPRVTIRHAWRPSCVKAYTPNIRKAPGGVQNCRGTRRIVLF